MLRTRCDATTSACPSSNLTDAVRDNLCVGSRAVGIVATPLVFGDRKFGGLVRLLTPRDWHPTWRCSLTAIGDRCGRSWAASRPRRALVSVDGCRRAGASNLSFVPTGLLEQPSEQAGGLRTARPADVAALPPPGSVLPARSRLLAAAGARNVRDAPCAPVCHDDHLVRLKSGQLPASQRQLFQTLLLKRSEGNGLCEALRRSRPRSGCTGVTSGCRSGRCAGPCIPG